jgi:hypothetical protein
VRLSAPALWAPSFLFTQRRPGFEVRDIRAACDRLEELLEDAGLWRTDCFRAWTELRFLNRQVSRVLDELAAKQGGAIEARVARTRADLAAAHLAQALTLLRGPYWSAQRAFHVRLALCAAIHELRYSLFIVSWGAVPRTSRHITSRPARAAL